MFFCKAIWEIVLKSYVGMYILVNMELYFIMRVLLKNYGDWIRNYRGRWKF